MPRKPRNQVTEKGEAGGVPAEDGKTEDTATVPQATPRRSSRQAAKTDYSGRSRRSSTAAQTAASKAESRTTECGSPVESPATRVKSARRTSGQVNYEESDGEEVDAKDEEEYKLDDESENESNSGDGSRRRGNHAAAAKARAAPRTPPRARGRPRGSTKSTKKDADSGAEEEEEEEVASPPKRSRGPPTAGTGRRGRRAAAASKEETPAPSRRSTRRGRKSTEAKEENDEVEVQEEQRKRKASASEEDDTKSKKAKVDEGKEDGGPKKEEKKAEEEEKMEVNEKVEEEAKEEDKEEGENETRAEKEEVKSAEEDAKEDEKGEEKEEKMEVEEPQAPDAGKATEATEPEAPKEPDQLPEEAPSKPAEPTVSERKELAPPPEPADAAAKPPVLEPVTSKPADCTVATVNGTESSNSGSSPLKENGSMPDGPQYLPNPSLSPSEREHLQGKAFEVVSLSIESLMKAGAEGAAREKFLAEVKSLNADVLCLQGVTSEEQYGSQLQSGLDALGYRGVVSASQATLVRASRFSIQSHTGTSLQSLISKDLEASPLEQADRDAVAKHLKTTGESHILTTRLTPIADGSEKSLLVANVSLVPTDPSTHALQACCSARELCREPGQGRILAGQLHLEPGSPAHQLLRDGYLDNDMIEELQRRKDVPLPDKENAALVNLLWKAFQHPSSSLRSCYATVKGSEIQGCSSMAWFSSDSLQVLGVLDPVTPSSSSLVKATLVLSN